MSGTLGVLLNEVRALRRALEDLLRARTRTPIEVAIGPPNLVYDGDIACREIFVEAYQLCFFDSTGRERGRLQSAVRHKLPLNPLDQYDEGREYIIVAEAALELPDDAQSGDRMLVWVDLNANSPNQMDWAGWRRL